MSGFTPKCSFLTLKCRGLPPQPPPRKIKTLGEDDPWLDDTAAWIERSRKLQQEKELAEKRVRGGGTPLNHHRFNKTRLKMVTSAQF